MNIKSISTDVINKNVTNIILKLIMESPNFQAQSYDISPILNITNEDLRRENRQKELIPQVKKNR